MSNKLSEYMIVANSPDSAAAEAFRILRTNISLRDFEHEMKVINIISATAHESKSTTIINLAYAFSQLGKRVLLLDLDLRAPTIHKKLHLKNDNGLAEAIAGKIPINDAFVKITNNFVVLLSGSRMPFASEFIQSTVFSRLLEALKKEFDMIFIDCPPINLVTDGMIISNMCDGTIFCVASGMCEKKDLIKAKDQLAQFDVNVLGVVMTRMPINKKYYNYDSKYGYYAYGNRKDTDKKKKKKVKL